MAFSKSGNLWQTALSTRIFWSAFPDISNLRRPPFLGVGRAHPRIRPLSVIFSIKGDTVYDLLNGTDRDINTIDTGEAGVTFTPFSSLTNLATVSGATMDFNGENRYLIGENATDVFCQTSPGDPALTEFGVHGIKFLVKLTDKQTGTLIGSLRRPLSSSFILLFAVLLDNRQQKTIAFTPRGYCGIYLLAGSDEGGALQYTVSAADGAANEPVTVAVPKISGSSSCSDCLPELPLVPVALFGVGESRFSDYGSLGIFPIGPLPYSTRSIAFLSQTDSKIYLYGLTGVMAQSGSPYTPAPPPTAAGTGPTTPPPLVGFPVPATPPTQVPVSPPSPSPTAPPCLSPKPTTAGYNFICSNSTWIVQGNVTLIETAPTNFVVQSGAPSTLTATGCVEIGSNSNAVVSLDPASASNVVKGNASIVLVESQSSCLTGQFSSISVRCADGSNSTAGCSPGCVSAEQRSSSRSISLLFTSVASPTCSSNNSVIPDAGVPWWAILLGVLGAVALICVVVGVVVGNRNIRRRLFPFSERRNADADAPRNATVDLS